MKTKIFGLALVLSLATFLGACEGGGGDAGGGAGGGASSSPAATGEPNEGGATKSPAPGATGAASPKATGAATPKSGAASPSPTKTP